MEGGVNKEEGTRLVGKVGLVRLRAFPLPGIGELVIARPLPTPHVLA